MGDKIFRKVLLGLRNNAYRVQLIVPNGSTKAVLGTSAPEEERHRVDVVTQWGKGHSAPRQQELTGIKLPLEQRTQTILYYQLTQSERAQLNGKHGAPSNSRKLYGETQNAKLYSSDNSALKDSD